MSTASYRQSEPRPSIKLGNFTIWTLVAADPGVNGRLRTHGAPAAGRCSQPTASRTVAFEAAKFADLDESGRAKAVRFPTLDAICRVLECQPGDLLDYEEYDATPRARRMAA